MLNSIRLFIRQPFTETSSTVHLKDMMNLLLKYNHYPMNILPYSSVGENNDFRNIFEDKTKIKFNPENFRNYRLNCIRKSNAMFVMRNNISESTAFELGYIYSKFPDLPIFFAIDNKHPIKTTLLQDLHPNTVYSYYDDPNDIKNQLYPWLNFVAEKNGVTYNPF